MHQPFLLQGIVQHLACPSALYATPNLHFNGGRGIGASMIT